LIVSQVFGLYGLLGGVLSPARILAVVLLIPIFANKFFTRFLKKEQFLMFFLVFTIGYSFVLILIYQSDRSINYLVYLALNLILLFEVVFLSNLLDKPYLTIWKAYLIFISITIPIAIVELMFDLHLSVSYLEADQVRGASSLKKVFASVTFGNYNLYNFILVVSTPILSSFFLSNYSKSSFLKWYTTVVLIVIFVIIVMNGSRAATINYVLSMAAFSWYYFKVKRFNKLFFLRSVLLIIPIIGLAIYYFLNSDISTYLLYRITNSGFEDNLRLQLIMSGLAMTADSYLIGVGPANYEEQLEKMGSTWFIARPHNMFIELLAEMGIFVFVLFVVLLFKIYKNIKYVPIHIKYVLVASLLTMPLNFVINSNYVYNVYMWMYFAALYVLSQTRKVKY